MPNESDVKLAAALIEIRYLKLVLAVLAMFALGDRYPLIVKLLTSIPKG